MSQSPKNRRSRRAPTSEPAATAELDPSAASADADDEASDQRVEAQGVECEEAAQEDFEENETGEAPSRDELKRTLESLVFVADRTVTAVQLGRVVKQRSAVVRELLAELQEEYRGRGIELWEVGGGYQFRSSPEAADYVRAFVAQRPVRLTRAQLETLALVAYRQPITRPEIDDVRGVDTGSAVRVLLERGLIKMLGRKDEAGRPLLYGTAPYFLEFFGLASLKDLPTLREFTELTDEHRELFQRKTGDTVEDAEAELAAASESEPDAPPDQDSEEAENEAAPRAQEDSEAEQVDDRDDDIPETLDDASARADL